MTITEKKLTREKHLDHMVRVVPLIVFAYAIQCYFIMKLGAPTEASATAAVPLELAVNGLFFLGACLAMMIAGFITYDLTHCVNLSEEFLTVSVSWLRYERKISYKDLTEVTVGEANQSFTTLSLTTIDGSKYRVFFVDEADKIKLWIEDKTKHELKAAA